MGEIRTYVAEILKEGPSGLTFRGPDDLDTLKRKAIDTLQTQGPMRPRALAGLLGHSLTTFWPVIQEMIESGDVKYLGASESRPMFGKVYLPSQVDEEFSPMTKTEGKRKKLSERILKVLLTKGPMPAARIHREFIPDSTHVSIDNRLREMDAAGLVVRRGKARQSGYPLSVIWGISDNFLEVFLRMRAD